MVNIMKHLHVTDCASLALSCKHLGRIVTRSHTLEFDVTGEWNSEDNVKSFNFFRMLQNSWVPKNLHLCNTCGKFQSTDKEYWKGYKEKWMLKPLAAGKLPWFWASGRNDGIVKEWCKKLWYATICPVCSAIGYNQNTIPGTNRC